MLHPSVDGRRVAFFGGSFDPPHRGHLAVARAARDALRLDQVLFAPVGAQPLKPLGSTAGFPDRLQMTRLAIADEPAFAISLADAPARYGAANSAPNYTIETLLRLRTELAAGDALFCLMGADSFLGLRRWHRGAEIPFVAPLIVASRPGQLLGDLAAVLPAGLSIDAEPANTAPDGAHEVHYLYIAQLGRRRCPLLSAAGTPRRNQRIGNPKAGARRAGPPARRPRTSARRRLRIHRCARPLSLNPNLPLSGRKSTMSLGELFSSNDNNDPQAHEHTRILVQAAAEVCEDKKGEDTRILELDPIDSGLSDFFLITSATNDRQAIAIADEIEFRLKKEFGVYPNSVEGRRKGDWILLDYVDFVVHVFLAERRAFYDIERLRKSARPITPAEFDAELKAALAAKTRAARGKAEIRAKSVAAESKSVKIAIKNGSAPKVKTAKPSALKPKKAANKSAAAAKSAPAKRPSSRVPAKPATKKAAAVKAAAKK